MRVRVTHTALAVQTRTTIGNTERMLFVQLDIRRVRNTQLVILAQRTVPVDGTQIINSAILETRMEHVLGARAFRPPGNLVTVRKRIR